MRKSGRLSATVLASALVVALALPAVAGEVTVGKFVQRLAQEKNLNATDAQIAVESLAAVGIRLPADLKLNRRLTERDVARIAQASGVNVTTANPSAPFDDDQVERFMVTFSIELGPGLGGEGPGETHGDGDPGNEDHGNAQDGGGPAFDPYAKGKGGSKGKKKGHSVTPSEPE